MNNQTSITADFGMLGIMATVHLSRTVQREWSDMNKRGVNIVFVIAIDCGIFVAGVSAYRGHCPRVYTLSHSTIVSKK